MFGGTKTLSVSKITSKRMTLPLTNLLSTKGYDMSLSSTPGAVQSRFQQIFQSSVNLGQSSQDFKKSLNMQGNLIQDSFITTWGIRMSKVFKTDAVLHKLIIRKPYTGSSSRLLKQVYGFFPTTDANLPTCSDSLQDF